MYPKQGENDRPRFYIDVEDIDLHTDRFKQAGGTVIVEKQEIPGFGWSVLGTDPEGNIVGLYQTVRKAAAASDSKSSTRKSSSKSPKKNKSSKSSKKKGRKR